LTLNFTYQSLRLLLDGMLLMMSLYSFACFIQQGQRILWQYGLYILCMIATFKLDDIDYLSANYLPGANYWVMLIESAAFTLYIRFSISLIEMDKYDVLSNIILNAMTILIGSEVVIDTFLWQANVSDTIRSNFYIICRLVLASAALVVVPRIYKLKQPVVVYFISGSFFFVLGCLLALGLNFVPQWFTRTPSKPFSYPVAILEIGVVAEVICYTLGISLKNRQNELDRIEAQQMYISELKENSQKEQTLRRIRDDIARDLHDELGGDLGSISMLCQVAETQLVKQPIEAKENIEIIGKLAQNVASSMRQIVWSLHSMHDNVDNFSFRLKETAYTIFEHQPIELTLQLLDATTDLKIPVESRRDLFLMYKEILNNIVRHAQAKNVTISSQFADQKLYINISDDGIGFDPDQVKSDSNGLTNLKDRIAKISGRLTIESYVSQGTKITIACPLA
jgi:signal transduction histidine kinase